MLSRGRTGSVRGSRAGRPGKETQMGTVGRTTMGAKGTHVLLKCVTGKKEKQSHVRCLGAAAALKGY